MTSKRCADLVIPEAVKKPRTADGLGAHAAEASTSRGGRGGRGRGRRQGKREAASSPAPEDGGDKAERRPKRKVAVFVGYDGTGYHGSQVQTSEGLRTAERTIEGELMAAFERAGCVSADNAMNPNKVSLQRAARTDANVHAACNVVCLKLILDPPSLAPAGSSAAGYDTLVNHLNTYLPPEIRIWGIVRVQNGFQARHMCDSRTYEYSLPSYVFLPPKPGSALHTRLSTSPGWLEAQDHSDPTSTWWNGNDVISDDDASMTPFQSDLLRMRKFRMSDQMMSTIRQSVAQFKGTHNFWNYTSGKDFRDRSAVRVMRDLEVGAPFLVQDVEWISITFFGQSFMLHQIRKMIGMVILLCRTRTATCLIPETFGPHRIHIPRAPGLGLLLRRPHFDAYNHKIADANLHHAQLKANGKASGPELEDREAVDCSFYSDTIDTFKRDVIYKRMWEDEKSEDGFANWIKYLEVYTDSDLDYLNPKGIIPTYLTKRKSTTKPPSHPASVTTSITTPIHNSVKENVDAVAAAAKFFELERGEDQQSGGKADDEE